MFVASASLLVALGTGHRPVRIFGFQEGWTISQRLVQLLGGEISAISQPGQGSTFTVRLPK